MSLYEKKTLEYAVESLFSIKVSCYWISKVGKRTLVSVTRIALVFLDMYVYSHLKHTLTVLDPVAPFIFVIL